MHVAIKVSCFMMNVSLKKNTAKIHWQTEEYPDAIARIP